MNAKKSLLALLAVAALALCLGPATVAATDGGAQTSAKKSKGKKGKSKACKGAKGKKGGKKGKGRGSKSAGSSAKKKGKKNKSRDCGKGKGKGGSAGSKLSNGLYEDPKAELKFKVTGGGSKIRLDQMQFPRFCIPLGLGSDDSVPLKTSKGEAVAKQTFSLAGGSIATLSWSVEIDPGSLRYSGEYTLNYEIPSDDPEVEPVRCNESGRIGGRLEH